MKIISKIQKIGKHILIYIFCFVSAISFFIMGIINYNLNQHKSDGEIYNYYDFTQETMTDADVIFNRLNMSNSYQNENNIYGAGSQWPTALATSTYGDLMLYGTDEGGAYKSVDHGENWTIASRGLQSSKVVMLAIDPKNSNHAVNISDQVYYTYDGAENWAMGNLPNDYDIYGSRYLYSGLEFDETSFDGESCQTIYMSTPFLRDVSTKYSPNQFYEKRNSLNKSNAGIYYSKDGGKNFEMFINDIRLADGIIKFTSDGRMFVGSEWGLFEINKETKEIKEYNIFSNQVLIDITGEIEEDNYTISPEISVKYDSVIYSYKNVYNVYLGVTGLSKFENEIYVQTWTGIYKILEDDSVIKITNDTTYPVNKWPSFLEVSSINPNNMTFMYRGNRVDNPWSNVTVYSRDGGKTWIESVGDNNSLFLTNNNWEAREKRFIFDPTDDNNIICMSTDTLFRSSDGGANYKQVNGISNMMCGGRFNFNYYDSDLMLFSAQDYRGAVTLDGGVTFKSIDFTYDDVYNDTNIRYEHMYGGFASDSVTYFGFVSSSVSGPYYLAITHNAGKTWTYYDNIQNPALSPKSNLYQQSVYFSCLQSYNNPNILYAENYISFDNGYTWQEMENCIYVNSINPSGNHELYGCNNLGELIVSYDDGISWSNLTNGYWETPKLNFTIDDQKILDTAIDYINNYVYTVVYIRLKNTSGQVYHKSNVYKLDLNKKTIQQLDINLDSTMVNEEKGYGYSYVRSIAIDPNCTSTIYVCAPGCNYISRTALLRSVDGGQTFSNLTTTNCLDFPSKALNQGGFEASCVRVLPTGRVVIACSSFGFEYLNPEYGLKNQNITPEHTVKFIVNNQIYTAEKVKNMRNITLTSIEIKNKKFKGYYFDKNGKIKFDINTKIINDLNLYAIFE